MFQKLQKISLACLNYFQTISLPLIFMTMFVKDVALGRTLLERKTERGLHQLPILQRQINIVNTKIQLIDSPYAHLNSNSRLPISAHKEHIFYFASRIRNVINLLHRRMGHPHLVVLKKIIYSCNKSPILNKNIFLSLCNACLQGKSHKQHFISLNCRASKQLELLHLDL